MAIVLAVILGAIIAMQFRLRCSTLRRRASSLYWTLGSRWYPKRWANYTLV